MEGLINSTPEEKEIINAQENGTSLQGNSVDELKNSKIVKNDEIELIKKWIDSTDNKVYFKLLYRATEHGKHVDDFHRRCDNQVRYIIYY